LVADAAVECWAFGWMYSELRWWKSEYEPAISGVHVVEPEDISEEVSQRFRFFRVQKSMSPDDAHRSILGVEGWLARADLSTTVGVSIGSARDSWSAGSSRRSKWNIARDPHPTLPRELGGEPTLKKGKTAHRDERNL
jgi:hypothetical protein